MSRGERKCWIRHAANCVKYPIHSHSHPFFILFYERKFFLCCQPDSFEDNSGSLPSHTKVRIAGKMRVKVTTLEASTIFIAIPHILDQRTLSLATCINNWFILVPHSLSLPPAIKRDEILYALNHVASMRSSSIFYSFFEVKLSISFILQISFFISRVLVKMQVWGKCCKGLEALDIFFVNL